jgi:polysaccharide pyruvyl transferase WcaK-like protein
MNIVIEISTEPMRNYGDIAMTEVAIARLRTLFPAASFQIISTWPERVPQFFPGSTVVSGSGHKLCSRQGALFGRFSRFVPWAESYLRTRFPCEILPLTARRESNDARSDVRSYLTTIREADLVVIPGGGWITDSFGGSAQLVLESIAIAQRMRKLTALMGHGFGPVTSKSLLWLARNVLPRVDLITLRESRASQPFLDSVGVSRERVLTTGDDAIELAHKSARETLGTGIGVNLRSADYAEVGDHQVSALSPLLRALAKTHHAKLIPLPIAFNNESGAKSDVETLRALFAGVEIDEKDVVFQTPASAIAQATRCRVMITGSYHGAVFALSQGIPAIGLASSPYYFDKFRGLAAQFGCGCEVVSLTSDSFPDQLINIAERLWKDAGRLKPELLANAAKQVSAGRQAYERLARLADKVCS